MVSPTYYGKLIVISISNKDVDKLIHSIGQEAILIFELLNTSQNAVYMGICKPKTIAYFILALDSITHKFSFRKLIQIFLKLIPCTRIVH